MSEDLVVREVCCAVAEVSVVGWLLTCTRRASDTCNGHLLWEDTCRCQWNERKVDRCCEATWDSNTTAALNLLTVNLWRTIDELARICLLAEIVALIDNLHRCWHRGFRQELGRVTVTHTDKEHVDILKVDV